MAKKKLTYESAMNEIEQIARNLEEHQVNMDQLPQKVERASELIKWCRIQLRGTEKQLTDLFDSKE